MWGLSIHILGRVDHSANEFGFELVQAKKY